MDTSRHASRWTLLFAAGLLAYCAGWVAIWFAGGEHYFWALRWFGIDAVMVPGYAAPLPFFDLEGVLSWSECARRGHDVLVANPCDPIGRLLNYSPLLAHPLLGRIGTAATVPIGFVLDAAFLVLIVLVVRPRNAAEVAIGWLIAGSPVFVYALDRCNFDVIVFLAAATVILVSSPLLRLRLVAAAGFVLGFLKFYPFCLLLLALRERLKTFLVVAGATAATLALFVVVYRHDLTRMAFPTADWSGDTFSARQVVSGLADLAGIPAHLLLPLFIALVAAAGVMAWKLSRRFDALLPPDIWGERDYALLLFAAVVMVSCFLVQANIYYRAIYLIATLPGLLRLRGRAEPGLRRLIGWALAVLVACLWAEMLRVDLVLLAGPHAERAIAVVILMLREPLWWFEMTVLTAIVFSFARQSQAVAGLVRRTGGFERARPVVLRRSHDPDRQT
jgi:hypothetical protein